MDEFQTLAHFDPLIDSVTIASDCNLYWTKGKLEQNLIALEPQYGWRGNQINQSQVALEWFYFQDWKLGGNQIRHQVRKGGEQQVVTAGDSFRVDGFCEETRTVYEFHGCFWHGCLVCFPTNRNCKRNCHADRIIQEVYKTT